MAISTELRVLARKLEKNSDDLLINASHKGPETFEKVATAVAAASTLLESVADDMEAKAEFRMTEQQFDEMVETIKAFNESGDDLLKKQASVMEELLLSIAAPKNAAQQVRKVTEDEVNRLREERRRARGEEAYIKPRQEHHDMWNSAAQAKAVEQQVKRYVPLEAPLQTRYPPDRPGGQMTRITDHVYQDIVTGIIYDYKAGYTTQKGNKIPGGSVENQTRQLGDYRHQSSALFETRDSLMGRYAADGDLRHLKKYALNSEIAEAIRAVRDEAPELVNDAIDHAFDDGLSTSEVANILSDEIKATGSLKDCLAAAGWDDISPKVPTDPKTNRESLVALALNAIQELAPHLLTAAVDKAQKELTDQQIKSILANGFSGKFEVSSFSEENEIKVAESLLPHLRDLGWNDLADHHLQVMAKLGIGIDKIQKFSGKKKSSHLHKLSRLLRDAAPARAVEVPLYETEEEPPPSIFFQGQPAEIEEAPPTIRQVPQGMIEEPAPGLFSELFGEPPVQGPVTPMDDLAEWNKVYEGAKQVVSQNAGVKEQMIALIQSGQRDEAENQLKRLINEEMNRHGFVGAYETDESGKEYLLVARDLGARPTAPEMPEEKVTPGAATNQGKELGWEEYQAKNKVVVSDEKASDMEKRIFQLHNSVKGGFDKIYVQYTFPGSDIPLSIERLPASIKSKLTPMYMRGETTTAMLDSMKDWLSEYVEPKADALTDDKIVELRRKSEELMEEAAALETKGEAEKAAKKMDQAAREEAKSNNREVVRDEVILEQIEKLMPSIDDLTKARKSLRGAENKDQAKRLRLKAISNALQAAANMVLDSEGLPPMFPGGEILTKQDFTKQMEELGKSEGAIARSKEEKRQMARTKRKSILVHPIPENAEGQRLSTIWEEPERYIEGLRQAKAKFPMKGRYISREEDTKKKWDKFMEEQGLVPPSYKLFGSTGSTLAMLRGFINDLDKVAFPDFGGLKNLFDSPDEYAQHYQEGQEKFGKEYNREKPPLEFYKIHGGAPNLSGIPMTVQKYVKVLYEKKTKLEDAVEEMQQHGVPPVMVKKVWESLQESGQKVRGMILARLARGDDPRIVMARVDEYYPDAHIPEGVIEFMYNFMMKKRLHNEKVNERWNKWSQSLGFYPPHKISIGKVTAHDLLRPFWGRRGDPDVVSGTPMAEMS